jgi:hypothetical protein
MTTTAMVTRKSTGLAQTGKGVRDLALRLERARQSRNERVARADADYVEQCRKAIADAEQEMHVDAPDSTVPEAASLFSQPSGAA